MFLKKIKNFDPDAGLVVMPNPSVGSDNNVKPIHGCEMHP